MDEKMYTLQKRKEKDEYHLFECITSSERTTCEEKSICKLIDYDEKQVVLSFLKEGQARLKCANGGRQVCRECVSYLYDSFK